MKNLRWGLAGTAVVATAIVVMLTRRPVEVPVSAAPVPASSPAGRQAVISPARVGCHFEAGQRVDVALTVQTGVELTNAPAPMPRAAMLAEAITTSVQLEVLEADGAHAVLVGAFADVEVTGHTPARAYAGPFLVEVDTACELTRFAHHQSTQRPEARLQQSVLWELAWRWTAGDEALARHNARGSYDARATTTTVGNEVLAQRRIESYGRLWLGGEATHVTGFGSATVAGGDWFDHLEADETLTSTSGTTRTRVRATASRGTGALTKLDRDATHYLWADLLSTPMARREALPVTPTDRALRAQLQDKSAAEVVQLAQGLFAKNQNLPASWPPLRAFLEARPEKTLEVVAELKQGKVTEDGLNTFFIAFGNARTPDARDALLGMMRDTKAPPAIRARAMFSLVDRADVGPPLATEFRAASQALEGDPNGSARFVATESLLALSTMAGLHEDSEVRGVAVDAVRERLTPDADRRTQATALKAMANLGDPSLLPEAVPYTFSKEERVRRAAAKVVRRMNPADTESFSVDWLRRETSLFVKKDVFVTLEAQHFDAKASAGRQLSRVLIEELKNEEHGVIARKALLRLVGASSLSQEPEVRALLKAQAKRALARRDGLASDALGLLTPEEIREVAP